METETFYESRLTADCWENRDVSSGLPHVLCSSLCSRQSTHTIWECHSGLPELIMSCLPCTSNDFSSAGTRFSISALGTEMLLPGMFVKCCSIRAVFPGRI